MTLSIHITKAQCKKLLSAVCIAGCVAFGQKAFIPPPAGDPPPDPPPLKQTDTGKTIRSAASEEDMALRVQHFGEVSEEAFTQPQLDAGFVMIPEFSVPSEGWTNIPPHAVSLWPDYGVADAVRWLPMETFRFPLRTETEGAVLHPGIHIRSGCQIDIGSLCPPRVAGVYEGNGMGD
ncbi:MAG: hypothetical protein FWH21_03185, partial [Kiritimatiellaeota bacterium]|nr:hypothetical protein [Kiritimatiellota bacterium]